MEITICPATAADTDFARRAHHAAYRDLVERRFGSWNEQLQDDQARLRGLPVSLRTAHANRAAALYRRLGFREIGRTETHILFEWHAPLSKGALAP